MGFLKENIEIGDMKKLGELIKDIEIAMLTTVDEKGLLRSRPMATQEMAEDGTLYFFIDCESPKVTEISLQNQINLVYSQPDDHRYISVSGRAIINRNKEKIIMK